MEQVKRRLRFIGPATGAILLAAPALAGCGSAAHTSSRAAIPAALVREARPIGRGARFETVVRGPMLGACKHGLGSRRGVHVEVFAANRVLLIPAGIGTRAPRAYSNGRISRAACYGELATLEPTGVVLVRRGARLTLADLFRSWGQPLSSRRLASFRAPAGRRITVYVAGRRWRGNPGAIPLAPHSEIVLEVGPHVPPHSSYTFPPGS